MKASEALDISIKAKDKITRYLEFISKRAAACQTSCMIPISITSPIVLRLEELGYTVTSSEVHPIGKYVTVDWSKPTN